MGVRNFLIVVALLLGLASYAAYRYVDAFDIRREFRYNNDEQCTLVGADIPGVEDITWFASSARYALGSSDLQLDLFELGNFDTVDGSIVLIDVKNETVSRLLVHGWPEGVAFHPHGISLFEERLLFVINHANARGGERIDVLTVSVDRTTPDWAIQLTYKHSMRFADAFWGTLNDLVAISEEEVYVTQWITTPHNPDSVVNSGWASWLRFLATHLFLEATSVHYVRFDGQAMDFRLSVANGAMFNGISTDGTDLYAVDYMARLVKRYRILLDKSLRLVEEIHTIRSIDNIEYDSATQRFYMGALTNVQKGMEFLEYVVATPNWRRVDVEVASGAVELAWSSEAQKWEAREVIVQKQLLHVSAAARRGKQILLGSPYDNGVLICSPELT